ncbi:MAG: hypothetical protein KGL21_07805 [Alphaproteobacteria bacterium]|nr:hypothetical protein [Alphaproteobacteria bacterium]
MGSARAQAWRRYRKAMTRLAVIMPLLLALGIAIDWKLEGPPPIHFIIAISLGIFAMVMLTAALMGLSFISAASGYDDETIDPTGEKDAARWDRTNSQSRPWSK